jgi:hypothetical protein
MENVVLTGPREESNELDTQKFLVMRALARLHDCEEETLFSTVDASESDVHEILIELISEKEVDASPSLPSKGRNNETFTLTLKGWGEYMETLGSIYELPE